MTKNFVRRLNRLTVPAAFILLGSAGVASPSIPGEMTKIKVNMSEMKFEVEGASPGESIVLHAGKKYKITFENLGQVRHEVLFGRGLIHQTGEMDYREHLLTSIPVDISGAWIVGESKRIFEVEASGIEEIELDAGTRLSIFVTLPESARGTWEIGCFAPGHHQSGMHLPLIVQ